MHPTKCHHIAANPMQQPAYRITSPANFMDSFTSLGQIPSAATIIQNNIPCKLTDVLTSLGKLPEHMQSCIIQNNLSYKLTITFISLANLLIHLPPLPSY